MMKDLVAILNMYRDKFILVLVMLLMPLALALFWTPWWATLICLLLVPTAGTILFSRISPPAIEPRRETDDPNLSDAQIRKMRKMSTGIQNLLSRWSQVSSNSHASIEQVHTHVDEVIAHSESAVVQISNNFIQVTRKTRKQVEYALSLLERTRGSSGKDRQATSRSLPELIAAYESILQQITASLRAVAETAQRLAHRHESMRENLQHVDTLLDQLSAHDSQIGMIALNTSVAAGTGGAGLVSMSDQIRTLSLQSKAHTRDIRRTLEEVKTQAQETYGAVNVAVKQAREAAQFADTEVGKLTGGMRETSHEVAEALAQISMLGNEIQADINNIIVALQFQDLTQQKLQSLKHPMLTNLTASLRAIFDETRAMSGKLEGSGLVDSRLVTTPSPARRSTDHPADSAPTETASSTTPVTIVTRDDHKPTGDASVEIF